MKDRYLKYLLLPTAILAAITPAVAGAQSAETYPSKPVTLLIAGGPGTTMDTTVRMFSNVITRQTGHKFIIDYKGGAGGTIGANVIAKAAPDGYNLLATISSYGISPAVYPTLPYDPLKDLAPITQMTEYYFILVVNPKLPIGNLAQYIAYTKANPGKLNFATSGQGSSYHMAGAWLHSLINTKVTFVHYKSGAARRTDWVGGKLLDAEWETPRSYGGDSKSGKARGLGVTSLKRLDVLPDMPTLDEQGVKGYDFSSWNGILAPGRTPSRILNTVQSWFAAAGKDPEVVKKLGAVEQEIVTSKPEEFKKKIAGDIAKWKKVAQTADIRIKTK